MQKQIYLLSLLAIVVLWAPLSDADEAVTCEVRVKFSSRGSIGEALENALHRTRSTLFVALYGFNNEVFAQELVKLARRRVKVRVKIDNSKTRKKRTRRIIQLLEKSGVKVQAVAPTGRNHNKFAVIDERIVITGSYNWTLRAETNWENLLILDCPKLAKRYAEEWGKIQ